MAETSRLQACEAFILFLNSYTCSLRSVQRDLSEALRLGKRVVVVRETSIRHGAALDEDGQFQLEKCCICDPHQQDEEGAFQAKLETHRRDVQEELETTAAAYLLDDPGEKNNLHGESRELAERLLKEFEIARKKIQSWEPF